MRLCLIPDEYTDDPATAFELGRRMGFEDYEIRHAYRWRAPGGPAWVADRVVAAARASGIRVAGISPGLFKPVTEIDGTTRPISTVTPEEIRRHLDELLPAFFTFAERLGTRNVTVFALARSPSRTAAPPQILIDSLGEAAARAEAEGFELRLENGSGSWADTAEMTCTILEAVNSKALRLTWDPANAVCAGPDDDPVRNGYPRVRQYVANVHVKDVRLVEGKPVWTMLGEGIVDWPAQIRLLRNDGYGGFLTAEPHLQYVAGESLNLVEQMAQFIARLREMVDGSAPSDRPDSATTGAMGPS
jgi:sugar phosphate isomerase/epimerase